jgi:hypothetical protein
MNYFRVGHMDWRIKSAEEVLRDLDASMPRQVSLDARVARANQLSLLGPFVSGDGEGSTIKTHRMVISLDVHDTYHAFMLNENDPLHGNPRGVRSVSGWGRTKDEAAKDAFALLWLSE